MTESPKRSTAHWLWPAIGAAALAAALVARFYQASVPRAKDPDPAVAAAGGFGAELGSHAAEQLRLRLIEAGWNRQSAAEVAALNEDFLGVLADEAPEQVERIGRTLARLGQFPALMEVLRQRPETAGLLAGAPDPAQVAESLRQDRRYSAVSNIYGRHGEDVNQVASALDRHGPLICHLIDEGMLGAETVFLFPRNSVGAEAYDQWLATTFQSAMTDEAQLAATFQVVMVQGEPLRRRMIDDELFRSRFPSVIWPRLERLVDQGVMPLELASLDFQLFDLLDLPQGERLVHRWGLMPLELLYGPLAYPQRLHGPLIATMLAGDNTTLSALLALGSEPLLAALLERKDVTPQVKAAALSKLRAAGSDYPALLRSYSEYTGAGLTDAVGPPPSGPVTWLPLYYTVYEVPKKIMQGRNPTLMDAVIAVLDPVFLVAGPLGPDDIVKVAGQQSLKGSSQRAAGGAVAKTLQSAARTQAGRQIGVKAASQLGTRESAPWLVTQMLRGTRSAVQRKVQSAMTVDITGPTRFVFRVTGASRESFRWLTRLEARIFMRPDRRVLVRLDRFLVGHPAGRFLADTAVAGMVETGAEIPAVENTAVTIARQAGKFPDQASAARRSFSAWQKNISAWWLSRASGVWNDLPPDAGKNSSEVEPPG